MDILTALRAYAPESPVFMFTVSQVEVITFSAKFQTAEGEAEVKNELCVVTKLFYLDYKSQIDCLLIKLYKATKIHHVTIHIKLQ